MIPDMAIGRFGLFLDVDGTLIDIAPRPDDVVVPRSLLQSLSAANELLGGALALVSGRSIADLDRLFHPLHLRASGVHGAEMRIDPAGPVLTAEADTLEADLVEALYRVASAFPGTLVENKRYSVAIHYRGIPSEGRKIHEALQHVLHSEKGEGLRILPGHMVFELKRATFDKGVAIGRFLAEPPFKGRCPVFFGDDVTDQPGFDAVLANGGYAYFVGEARPGVSGFFPTPAAVRAWLAGLAKAETCEA